MKMKRILNFFILVPIGLMLVACNGSGPSESQTLAAVDFYDVKARISGRWVIAYGNSGITISDDGRYEENWDNMTIINGSFTISRENETDYRLTFIPERVRILSANQPEFGYPGFDDEQYGASPSWAQRYVIINPSNQERLGLVGNDGTVEWVDIWFNPEVLWLDDRI
ncbi:MAG: hypothetical protein FWE21_04685 [Defluviitaleaceae bacterium]|nr:hypothetical protein [Defluviitaleaceae bacterium]